MTSKDAADYYQLELEKVNNQDFPEAINNFSQALKLEPDFLADRHK